MIEDHEIEIVIRDTNNNVLKVEKVPARSARATIYIQVGQPNTGLLSDGKEPCPKCGYRTALRVCPECGHDALAAANASR